MAQDFINLGPSAQVGDRYLLDDWHREGGMADVYRARDLAKVSGKVVRDRQVAIKVMAYAAPRCGKWLIVVDDQPGPEFDEVAAPVFSPDGNQVTYGARKGRELWRKVFDVRR